jgi:hypothetical protein
LLGYRLSWSGSDIAAGVVVTTMLVPVGIAYAVASGLPGAFSLPWIGLDDVGPVLIVGAAVAIALPC